MWPVYSRHDELPLLVPAVCFKWKRWTEWEQKTADIARQLKDERKRA